MDSKCKIVHIHYKYFKLKIWSYKTYLFIIGWCFSYAFMKYILHNEVENSGIPFLEI